MQHLAQGDKAHKFRVALRINQNSLALARHCLSKRINNECMADFLKFVGIIFNIGINVPPLT